MYKYITFKYSIQRRGSRGHKKVKKITLKKIPESSHTKEVPIYRGSMLENLFFISRHISCCTEGKLAKNLILITTHYGN